MTKRRIKEVIVVEGRDDEAAVHRAVDATTIATHGFGIRKETFDLIEKAYREKGIILFTDPDVAGENIRKRLTARFPNCRQAYLPRAEAMKNHDIGIENACPEDIRAALFKVKCTMEEREDIFSSADMTHYGLSGSTNSSKWRAIMGKALGIGYGNGKEFLRRLNQYGITREEFEKAWTSFIRPER